jgi:hypothetical protein
MLTRWLHLTLRDFEFSNCYRVLAIVVPLVLSNSTTGYSASESYEFYGSPEVALAALEEAYRRHDIEAAVRLKDFYIEAAVMLGKPSIHTQTSEDKEILKMSAEVLELSFRKAIQDNGFPDFSKLICSVVDKKSESEGLVYITEQCESAGLLLEKQVLLAAFRDGKWRIVGVDESKN